MAGRPRRGRRRLHHSPLFWIGAVLFLAAITFYFLSDDLALRPVVHSSARDASEKDRQGEAGGQDNDQGAHSAVDRSLMTQIGGARTVRG